MVSNRYKNPLLADRTFQICSLRDLIIFWELINKVGHLQEILLSQLKDLYSLTKGYCDYFQSFYFFMFIAKCGAIFIAKFGAPLIQLL